jgi:hypothetical protein
LSDSSGRQPYYYIGQWRLSGDRRLRAFVSSAQGTVHFARIGDDGDELMPAEISECYKRIFPDLLRRLRYLTLEVPGLLHETALPSTGQTAGDHEATDGSAEPTGRLGQLLVQDGLITDAQLQAALRLQAASRSYVPIGHVLVAHGYISRKALTLALRRHQKSVRLGEVLLKDGHITAAQLEEALEHQRGTPLRLGQMLVRLGWVPETAMRGALCTQLHVNFIDIDAIAIDRDVTQLIPESFARQHSVVPLLRVDDVVVVAMDNPGRDDVIEALERSTGLRVEAVTTLASKLKAAMDRVYAASAASEARPSDGSVIIGPVRDYAVAELVMRLKARNRT